MSRSVVRDAWQALRRLTPARIALGRAGASLPTDAVLAFGLAHAQARDAVHTPLDRVAVARALQEAGFDPVAVRSTAPDRPTYLRRPDFGRRLDADSRARLQAIAADPGPEVLFVVADGLSARAIHAHAVPLLQAVAPRLAHRELGPVVVAEQARVALGDEIAEILRAEQVVMLIGERPGLSSPDSLGVYFTHAPRIGRTDAERNCISNIRDGGLDYGEAAVRLDWLLEGARRLGRSGVALKGDSEAAALPGGSPPLAGPD